LLDEELEILTPRVDDHLDVGVRYELPDGREIYFRKRIKEVYGRRGRDLNEAQTGPKGPLAQELRVDPEAPGGVHLVDDPVDIGRAGNERGLLQVSVRRQLDGSPSSRAMRIRMTSDVPSPISRTFESLK
jgi:hypothetical protein